MTVELVCTAHSPIMECYSRAPAQYDAIEDAFAARRARIDAFDPELVVVFGTDHFNGVFLSMVPPFSVGLKARAVGDIGGFPGPLDVPAETALSLVEAVRADGVDIAVSYDMTVDHGFSQPMQRLMGALDRFPTIPVFVNGIIPPFVPFARSRALGEAIGRYLGGLGTRVLVIGSGGMSHNPRRYYPDIGQGEPDVAGYQLSGGEGPGLSKPDWLERLRVMHLEGADMLADGRRTREDICLNPEFDAEFLEIVTSDDLKRIDGWDPAATVARAGIGSLELHTWIAACAANRAAQGRAPTTAIYADTLEYGIGFGLIYAGAA